jgi:rRNA maturation RNase YbeY
VIRFFVAEGGRSLRQKRMVRSWLHEILTVAGYDRADLNFIFCGDEYLYRLNREFLNHDTYTDIITFSEYMGGVILQKKINGECYISTDRVAENAALMNVGYTDELHRVMVHGLLHLLGQGDKTKHEKATMRQMENSALQKRRFSVQNPGSTEAVDINSAGAVLRHATKTKGRGNKAHTPVFHVEQKAKGARAGSVSRHPQFRSTASSKKGEQKAGASMFHVEHGVGGSNKAMDDGK